MYETMEAKIIRIQTENERLRRANDILKAQIQAQSDRSDFVEDCIAEMATMVYGGV